MEKPLLIPNQDFDLLLLIMNMYLKSHHLIMV